MKVSLICTLKNEESYIKEFMDSLLAQSRPPNEIIIVDGGSTDGTAEIINSYIRDGAPIRLMVKEGANISQGRNTAIKNARYEIIASTDAGCRVDRYWLENLMKPFEEEPGVDVVSGWYEADTKTGFEEFVAELTSQKLDRVLSNPDRFLPSSRSVAFKKTCWEKAGGYPEWLYTAEDTLFDLNLKKADCKFAFAPEAVVGWRVRTNIKDVFKQYYLYFRGDGQARIFRRGHFLTYVLYGLGLILLLSGFINKLLWVLLFICILCYFLKFAVPVYRRLRSIKAFFMVPAIKLAIDLGHMVGYFVGTIEGVKIRRDLSKSRADQR